MTNEELALQARDGNPGALLQLWEQNVGLARIFSARRLSLLLEKGNARGAEFDDFMQAAFLALMRAVDYYAPEKEYSFNSYWAVCVKAEFNALLGLRTRKHDPIDYCYSLDTPLHDEADSETIGDMVLDPTDVFEKKEHEIWLEELHETLEDLLAQLTPEQSQALRLKYYDELTQEQAAKVMGVTRGTCRQLTHRALRELRKPSHICELETFIDARTNFYKQGSAERQNRPVEENAVLREQLLSSKSWDPFW